MKKMLVSAAVALAVLSPATSAGAAPKSGESRSGVAAAKKVQAPKPKKFVLTGVVTAVDSQSVTLDVKGGNTKSVKGMDVQVNVAADASIKRNDLDATLAEVLADDHVMLQGYVVGDVFTAVKVRAEGIVSPAPEPAPEPTPVS